MNLSMRWLSDYVKMEKPIDQYIADMTMSGTKVEGYETEGTKIKKVVVGKVLSIVPHENADSLIVCQLDVGADAPVQIVTGATNVVVGAMVPVALHKSTLPDGTVITRGKLRGEASEGMLCSLEELNLSIGDFPYGAEDGILLLEEDDIYVGQPITEAIGLNDTVVEFEVTSNRPDCLSVLGLARETAATYGEKFTPPIPVVKGGGKKINDILSLTVENKELCKRYMAAAVENVKVEPSPRWMRERLRASGIRPINNIVDITNYVMLEYGHPMHAFDLRHVKGQHIVVRNAKAEEVITTLDGEERKLSEEMLVIADDQSATAVAGVMGGEYSGIYDDTTTVIFESACFDGTSVRHTAKHLGMRTESSGRFEKGLDSRNCEGALERACELIELLGAGTVAEGMLDVDNDQQESTRIPFDADWINEFIGVNIPKGEMETILDNLGFTMDNNEVVVPSFRQGDMAVRNDVAEEVIRIYGYDHIPTTVLRGESKGLVTREQHFRNNIGGILIAQGYSEIKTYSFYSPKNFDKIHLDEKDALRNCVAIRNPLGEDTSVLRTTAIPSMMTALAYNYNNRNQEGSLFEIASRYIPRGEGQLPHEPKHIMLGQYGKSADFFTLKGGVEALLKRLGVAGVKYVLKTDHPTFHPGRCALLVKDDQVIGMVGEIHPLVAENYEMSTHAYLAELDYEAVMAAAHKEILFAQLPKFPASTRDLAFVCDISLPVGEIEEYIRRSVGSVLESVELFDVFQGEQVGAGKKSVAYALILRAKDRTLTDKECDAAVNKALEALAPLGVVLRG